MTLKTKKWDAAEHMRDEEEERMFLEEVASDGTPAELAHAIEIVARVRGMRLLARETGLPLDDLFDLINPYDDDFDGAALRKACDALISAPSRKTSNAA